MTTVVLTESEAAEVERGSAKWWVLLITGILWIVIALVVLDGDWDSAATVGFLIGAYLIAAGVMEFGLVALVEGWKWVHVALGVMFVIVGIACFLEPFQTFSVLARMFGFLLVLKGTFDFCMALMTRRYVDLWWLTLIAGILEIMLGVWASGYPGRSATLLLVWVGVGALLRGITQIVLAFQVRKLHEAVV